MVPFPVNSNSFHLCIIELLNNMEKSATTLSFFTFLLINSFPAACCLFAKCLFEDKTVSSLYLLLAPGLHELLAKLFTILDNLFCNNS